MPIYEYRCQACGASFSDLVRMGTRPDEVRCPRCGERQSERLFSAFATGAGSRSEGSSGAAASCGRGSGFS